VVLNYGEENNFIVLGLKSGLQAQKLVNYSRLKNSTYLKGPIGSYKRGGNLHFENTSDI
jgi:hypothetical protein